MSSDRPESGSAFPRGRSARAHLTLLIVALLVPVLTFSSILLNRFAAAEASRFETEARERARAAALDIDRDVASLRAALQTLATSARLAAGNFEGFHRQASEVRGFTGIDIVLRDAATRQQVMNTRVPYGTPLPVTHTIFDDELLRTRRPVVSDVYAGVIANRPLYAVAVPVIRDGTGEVTHLLAFSIETDRLVPFLTGERSSEWLMAIADRRGNWLARSVAHAEFSGRPGRPEFLASVPGEEGTWTGSSPDGRGILVGYVRSKTTGWLVTASLPLDIVRGPLYRTVGALAGLGAGAAALSLLLAWLFGRRFTGPLGMLADDAARLGRGEPVEPARTGLREADAVAAAMAAAATELRDRQRARDAAEATLRESEERQRLIVESATDYAIISLDLDGCVATWSAGARRILGWERREVTGHHIRLIFVPEDQVAGAPEAEMRTALAEGRAADERWHARKDGIRFWASGELQPMRGADGAVIGFLKILRDRTRERESEDALRELNATLERKVAERTAELTESNGRLLTEMQRREATEDQLRQLQKMEAVGQLTGGIAHDFNNMLAVVIGSLTMMRRRLARGETEVTRFVDAAMDGATRAATLTQRLLAFSRQQPLAPEPVDGNKLIAGMSELLRRTLGEQVRLETVLAGGLWRTHADPSQLENAILNLAVNGRDAMPEGGRLTIETANVLLDEGYAARHVGIPHGQYVMLAVTDTGIGMPAEVQARAFDPFFTTKAVGKGTGLGLSQVYGFVRQSGGHIKIYSEPGQGTSVKIYLPRFFGEGASEAIRRAPSTPMRDLPAGDPREIVLVVEDEERVRTFTVEALRELGYTVIHADGAGAALRQLDAHPEVTLLFTDIVMPDVNGRRLADEALRRRPGLKVLYTTGYTRNAVVHNGVLDPGTQLITKPFTLEQLAVKVRDVLGAPAAT